MKVLIDSHMIGAQEGGNERYVKNLFDAIHALHGDKISQYIGNQSENNFYRLLIKLPVLVSKKKYDIVHSTYNSPLIKNAKFVLTLHDVSFRRFPQHFNLREQLIFKYLLPFSLYRAEAIIVPTEFTKKEAIYFFPFIKNKVYVTYYAADIAFHKIEKEISGRTIKNKYKIDKPFLLCLNSRYPKKNIQTVVDAFNQIQAKYPQLELVIIGGDYNLSKNTLGSRIHILSFIDDTDLNYFYNSCEAFIYYSIYEGFGLPILEAISCEKPIILSDTEVHQEITQDKLIYGAPDSPAGLATQISSILDSATVKDNLIKRAIQLNKSYSWKKTAQATYEIYGNILK